MDPLTGREWLDKAHSGDPQAHDALLRACFAPLETHLRGRIPGRWQSVLTIEDVIQDTYIEAIENFSVFSYRGEGSFLAWLRSLADCNLADAMRALEADKRGGGWNRLSIRSPNDSTLQLFETLTSATPSLQAGRQEGCDRLLEAVARLAPAYQTVVRGFDLEGHSMEEVAAGMDRTVGAAYMLRMRAHRHLREFLGSTGHYFEPGE